MQCTGEAIAKLYGLRQLHCVTLIGKEMLRSLTAATCESLFNTC